MTPIELIEHLEAAQTVNAMARITIQLLRACGIHNPQIIGQEISRIAVTSGPE